MIYDKRSIKELSYVEFLEVYVDKKVLIITDVMEDWPLAHFTLETFKEEFGDKYVPIRGSNINDWEKYMQVTMKDYIENVENNNQQWYCDFNPELKGFESLKGTFTIPEYFTRETVCTNKDNILYQWLYLGGKNTGTPLHADVGGSNAWNGLIFGQKEWIVCESTSHIAEYVGKVDLFDKNDDLAKDLLSSGEHIQFLQEKGELVYIPSNFPHQVRNNNTTLCLTGNFWFKNSTKPINI